MRAQFRHHQKAAAGLITGQHSCAFSKNALKASYFITWLLVKLFHAKP